jgi:hypothetical protein
LVESIVTWSSTKHTDDAGTHTTFAPVERKGSDPTAVDVQDPQPFGSGVEVGALGQTHRLRCLVAQLLDLVGGITENDPRLADRLVKV